MKDHMTTVTGMLTLILQLGITMLVPIVVCTIGGNWLGERLGWMGFPVLGFVVGAVAGMQGAWKLIRRMTADWPDSPVSQAGLAQAAKAARFADGMKPEEAVRDAGFTDGGKPEEAVRGRQLTEEGDSQ